MSIIDDSLTYLPMNVVTTGLQVEVCLELVDFDAATSVEDLTSCDVLVHLALANILFFGLVSTHLHS